MKKIWLYSVILLLTLATTDFAQEVNKSPAKDNVVISKAIKLTKPPYPPASFAVKASGIVLVEIIGDENGDVAFARAAAGHPLLRAASVQAARNTKFLSWSLDGKPVKFTGVIAYNYVLLDRSVEIQVIKQEIAPNLTNEIVKEIKINAKFALEVAELVKKVKQGEGIDNNKFEFVRDGKAEVLVWITDYSPNAFEELKTKGFKIKAQLENLKKS